MQKVTHGTDVNHLGEDMRVLIISISVLIFLSGISCYHHYNSYEYYEYYSEGVEYGAQAKFEEAQRQFEKALDVSQPCPPTTLIKRRLKIIDDVIKEKITKEAGVYLFKAIARINKTMTLPENLVSHKWRNVTYRRSYLNQWRLDDAINDCKKVITLYPNYGEAYRILGIAYYYKEMYDESVTESKKALKSNPNDALVYYDLGFTYLAKEMLDEACGACEKALYINPKFGEVHKLLAKIYYCKLAYELAIEHCEKLAKLGCMVPSELLHVLKPYDYMGKLKTLNFYDVED
ncbi:tetratricopeptide repeat protein [candidate division WOR-3 bacterium]|nr:tetratricopeptide repeat protein [candidate division WOR-3 bacterium]